MTPRARTVVVALFVAAVAVRVSVSQPLTSAVALLAADPGVALHRALSGWTVQGTLGNASAQGVRDAPLAALLWLGDRLGISPDLLQTGWRVVVVVLAVVGAVRLARRVHGGPAPREGDAEPWTPWIAALLFTVGVVLVPTVVRSPLDGLAMATLPWILAPLVLPGPIDWRTAARSAVWIGVAGVGTSAWAVAALGAGLVGVLPRLRRRDLASVARWVVLAAASSVWWGALAVWEGSHARDVTPLMQDPSLRQLVLDVLSPDIAMPYVVRVAVVAGPLLTVLAALVLRPPGARRFLVAVLSVGGVVALAVWAGGASVVPVVAPPAGDRAGEVVGPAFGWLALAALVAWGPLMASLAPRLRAAWAERTLPVGPRDVAAVLGGAAVVLLAVGGAAAAGVQRPAVDNYSVLQGRLTAWSASAGPGRVLVLPAGEDGATDLGLALGDRPWVARDAVPVSGTGATAALDDLIARLDRGDGGPGTTSALHRLGISYVLVALDARPESDRARPTALVRAALVEQGATRRRVISAGDPPDPGGTLVDFDARGTARQVEIWAVPAPEDTRVYVGDPAVVVGDAGSVSDLAGAGTLTDRAVRITAGTSGVPLVLSDSARRRDVDQRLPADPYGAVLRAGRPRVQVPDGAAPVTTAVRDVTGVRAVTASSSASDLDVQVREDGTDPLAAVDGNAFTAWQSAPGRGAGEWWQVAMRAPVGVDRGTVQFVQNAFGGDQVTRVRVTTDKASKVVEVPRDGLVTLPLSEPTRTMRVTVIATDGTTGPADRIGISEVSIPGVEVTQRVAVSGPTSSAWLLGARTGSAKECVPAVPRTASGVSALPTVCAGVSVSGADSGSLARVITNKRAGLVGGEIWFRAARTAQAASLANVLADPTVYASASSVAAQDLVTRAQAAADDDPTTSWRPSPQDAFPTLTLRWKNPARIEGIRLVAPAGTRNARPTEVRVTRQVAQPAAGTAPAPVTTEAKVGEDGLVELPPARADQMTVTILADSRLASRDSYTGGLRRVPVAVAEVEILGGPEVRYGASPVRAMECGSGPVVTVDGHDLRTRVTTSPAAIVSGEVVRAAICGTSRMPVGRVDVGVEASFTWVPLGALLWRSSGPGAALDEIGATGAPPESSLLVADLHGDRSTVLTLSGSTGERTLGVAVPAGSGWTARGDDGTLPQVDLDGWAQGWVAEPGVTKVVLTYEPASSLRLWSLAGVSVWGLVVLLVAAGAVSSLLSSRRRSR